MRARVLVSSASRDHDRFPEPSEYEAEFPSTFKNVFSVSLVAATLPQTDDVISSKRDTLHVTVNGGPATPVTLAHGSPADVPALAASLQNALASAFPATPFTASCVANKIKISSQNPFAIVERGDLGLYRTLGLRRGDNIASGDTSTTESVLHAAYMANIRKDSVVVLSISGMEVVTSNGNDHDRTFAVLQTGHMHKSLPATYCPARPIAKLPKMRVALTRADGTPCDFQGQDHYLQFDIDHGSS